MSHPVRHAHRADVCRCCLVLKGRQQISVRETSVSVRVRVAAEIAKASDNSRAQWLRQIEHVRHPRCEGIGEKMVVEGHLSLRVVRISANESSSDRSDNLTVVRG